MDSSLRIRHMGDHILKLFPSDVQIIGRLLDEAFRLIRPDIHVEWDKVFQNFSFFFIIFFQDSFLWSTYCIFDGKSITTTHWAIG